MPPATQQRPIKQLLRLTYLSVIAGSVGTKMFRRFYAEGSKRRDILEDGNLSCAYFVSAVLHLFKLIEAPHVTVAGTIKDMESSGWRRIPKARIGCVIEWEKIAGEDGNMHSHLGFYVGSGRAISNSAEKGVPVEHHWTFGATKSAPRRAIAAFFWHTKLDSVTLS